MKIITKNMLNGLKNFILKPQLFKIVLLLVAVFFTKFLIQINKEDPNIIYMGIIVLIIPGLFFFLGIEEEEEQSIKRNQQLQISNQNELQNDYNNDHEIVDRVERRTITTNKTETIETIYFLDGHPYKQKQTYYFKGDD